VSGWQAGRDQIVQLLKQRHLDQVSGEAADGYFRLEEARQRLASAQALAPIDAVGAFEMAYDAVRQAATALLLQQGLRPRSDGGHVAVAEAVRAQFGASFDMFNVLRRVRNRLEYPDTATDLTVDQSDLREALQYAQRTVTAVEELLPNLTFWQ